MVQAFLGWGDWSEWSPCSVTCDIGQESRTRSPLGERRCEGPGFETRSCSGPPCTCMSCYANDMGSHGYMTCLTMFPVMLF